MFQSQLVRLLFGTALTLFITTPALAQTPDLVVYTYDSFNSEWGPGPVVFKRFEEHCGCTVKVIAPGDSGTVLSRTILEKANPKADVLSLPAYDQCLKASHIFNLLEARGVISVAQRAVYISRIRELAKGAGSVWLETQNN